MTTAVAAVAGVPGPRCVLLACATLTGQASVGWTNDDIDADRDRAAGRADKPVAAGTVSRGLVRACAAGALTATVPLSLLVGWRAGAAHLAAVGWGWMYDVRLKETSASALPYVVSFGLLPVAVAAALPGSPHPQPTVVGAAALLGIAAHFANTVGDADDDAATGVRGLPQRVGPRRSLVVAAGTLLAAAVLLAAATGGSPLTDVAATVTALGFGVTAMAGRGRRTPFLAVLVAAGFLVLAFLATGADHLTR